MKNNINFKEIKEKIDKTRKNIIISAINIRAGGPLTILRNCLAELSCSQLSEEYNIIALVCSKNYCHNDNIIYIEFPKARNRVYSYLMEYFGFKKISEELNSHLWISLTDKTPNVKSDKSAVYLHNPTPFFKAKIRDYVNSPFLALYIILYKYICRINIHKNNFIIVQQNWIRDAYTEIYKYPISKCIVFPPIPKDKTFEDTENIRTQNSKDEKTFIYASLPRSFKNFEIICMANKILLGKGIKKHKIILTLKGTENRYAKYVLKKYGRMENILFTGVVSQQELIKYYIKSDCMIFASRLETWGLPISEYKYFKKPLLIADLPYAHNTSAGYELVKFFNPYNEKELAEYMGKIIDNDYSFLEKVPNVIIEKPNTKTWEETVNFILS